MKIGIGELAVILFVALLIFGPSKLPEFGKVAGETLKEFKKGLYSLENERKEKE
ncbi:twin-arginine translocase TatA/TatE family subunit [Fervidibacillus albus]|uniref:Twin-arginine translocase TatA/TatE family subunit n=1 Tax=Fervidibacillus albus TaxID=2980026 RepID=A0A9E8LSI5_9BACI|nr:twin-arginine translocase TatA/TatE family subunit [Fervidibacillus albus]WAA08736.1 twin-arginine translocase TatA/TatE family subunit [Fervidibacillus albus]